MKYLFLLIIMHSIIACDTTNSENSSRPKKQTDAKDSTIQIQDSTKQAIDTMMQQPRISLSDIDQFLTESAGRKLNATSFGQQTIQDEFSLLADIFGSSAIDSIVFWGSSQQKPGMLRLGLNNMLVVFLNDKKLSIDYVLQFYDNWQSKFKLTDQLMKAGGIVFEWHGQLCFYNVNTCGPGTKVLLAKDSLLKKQLFGQQKFIRLHKGCGRVPFKKLEE